MADRRQLLLQLLRTPKAARAIVGALGEFGWDSEVELVTLRAAHVIEVLRAYTAGNLTASEVEDWADALEVRDDVSVEGGQDGPVRSAVHVLANPALEGTLSPERARLMCDELAG